MGVVSRRWVWLVVRRYIDILTIMINFPYSTCISSFFWQQHPYFFVHFLNVFSVLFLLCFYNIVNVTQRTFEIVQKKSRSANIIGASLSEPHTYRTAVQNPPYIYIYTCRSSDRPSVRRPIWFPRWAPLNAQRANVGPASNDSKVDNIALKTATLVSRFS